MFDWLRRHLGPRRSAPQAIPDALWEATLGRYPFLAALDQAERERLRRLASHFLAQKEFQGASGLVVSDAMALAVAAQACRPLLHLGPPGAPETALRWYDDFVGIVMHPDEVLARREVTDEHGIVHRYSEALAGEAMDGGPVMLSWRDVDQAGVSAAQGYNVVIHEFIHKMDLRDGQADGCPPLPAGFRGAPTARAARAAWLQVLQAEYQRFREQLIVAERFGGAPVWLDPYGATAPDEFFAVACEAYFVNRARFLQELAPLAPLFDAFFQP